jgi:hypothetical protein
MGYPFNIGVRLNADKLSDMVDYLIAYCEERSPVQLPRPPSVRPSIQLQGLNEATQGTTQMKAV